MNAEHREVWEMGMKVQEQSQAHPDSSAGFAAAQGTLDGALAEFDAQATQERAGTILERNATARKRDIRGMVRYTMLSHIARVAEAASKERPELARKFRLPRDNGSYQAFRTAARAMAEEAVAQKELLVRYGLSEPLLESLLKALEEFDEAMEQAAAGRRAHVGAGAKLSALAQQVKEVVRVLDGLNRFRFANDPEKLAAWESAINLAGPSRRKAELPEEDTGGPSQEPEQIKPAM